RGRAVGPRGTFGAGGEVERSPDGLPSWMPRRAMQNRQLRVREPLAHGRDERTLCLLYIDEGERAAPDQGGQGNDGIGGRRFCHVGAFWEASGALTTHATVIADPGSDLLRDQIVVAVEVACGRGLRAAADDDGEGRRRGDVGVTADELPNQDAVHVGQTLTAGTMNELSVSMDPNGTISAYVNGILVGQRSRTRR